MVRGIHGVAEQGAVGKVLDVDSHEEGIQSRAGPGAAHTFGQQSRADGKLTVGAAQGREKREQLYEGWLWWARL